MLNCDCHVLTIVQQLEQWVSLGEKVPCWENSVESRPSICIWYSGINASVSSSLRKLNLETIEATRLARLPRPPRVTMRLQQHLSTDEPRSPSSHCDWVTTYDSGSSGFAAQFLAVPLGGFQIGHDCLSHQTGILPRLLLSVIAGHGGDEIRGDERSWGSVPSDQMVSCSVVETYFNWR